MPNISCQQCGTVFHCKPNQVLHGTRFCSRRCFGEGKRLHRTATCPCCNQTFAPRVLKNRTQKFCSSLCRQRGLSTPLEVRFWQYVDKSNGPCSCWLWTKFKNQQGYGMTSKKTKRHTGAHRVAFELTFGAIPDGQCVLHKCDNPSCVNPNHLFLGTRADNNEDKFKKGRQMRGEKHPNAKLTTNDVLAIRTFLQENHSMKIYQELGEKYGVTLQTIQRIYRKTSWRYSAIDPTEFFHNSDDTSH